MERYPPVVPCCWWPTTSTASSTRCSSPPSLGRLPRFIAKGGLRKIPIAGLVLRSAGVVFVHRREDKDGAESNEDAFADCHRALASATSWRSSPRAPPTTGPDRSDQDGRRPHRPRRPGRRRQRAGHRAGGAHVPRQGGVAVVGARRVRRADRPRRRRSRRRGTRMPMRSVSSPRSSTGHPRRQPRLPGRRDRARPRPGSADRPQQPRRPRPVARDEGRSRPPARSHRPRRTGRGASRRRPLPHDAGRAAPDRHRRHHAHQSHPPAAVRLLDRRPRDPPREVVAPPPS